METCSGCRDGILNQLGHMDEGGCLYDVCKCKEEEFYCPFCKTVYKAKPYNLSCVVHKSKILPEILCTFCHR